MATYEATITSAWPADETFGYLAVFSNAELWDPGVLSGQQLDPGPVRVGTRFRLIVPFLGRKLPLTYRVTEYSSAERLVTLDAISGMLAARDRITVRPHPRGRGADVGYRADVTLRGPLRLLGPLLGRGFRAVGERAAAGLSSALAAEEPRAGRTGVPGGAGPVTEAP